MGKEFIQGLSDVALGGCVATIGSYDGVHLGHQAILNRLIGIAQKKSLPSLVMIFEPQPFEYFAPDRAAGRLMRLREKVNALFEAGIDKVLCLKFNAAFRSLSAEAFIQQVLVAKLGVKHLEIGDDFRFGCDRAGDFELLRSSGIREQFSVEKAATFELDGARVSSTRIRNLLSDGKLMEARMLLGRPYQITGRVIYGRQLGRSIGVPTANVSLGRNKLPLHGVFAVRARAAGAQQVFEGVANIGYKPSLNELKPSLEAHLFDCTENLYGQCLSVEFCEKIREEKSFASINALQEQIQKDIQAGQQYFSKSA